MPRSRYWLWLLGVACHPVARTPVVATPPKATFQPPRIDREQILLSRPGCEEFPQPTADGKYIYFDGSLDNGFTLQRLTLATNKVERLTQSDESIWDFSSEWNYANALSPSGDRLVYLHDGTEGTELRLMVPGEEPVTLGTVTDTEPIWLDGRRVLAFGTDDRLLEFDADQPASSPVVRAEALDGFQPFGIIALDEHRVVTRMNHKDSGETLWSLFALSLDNPVYTLVPRPNERTQGLRFKTGERGSQPNSFYYVRGDVYDNATLIYRTVDNSDELELKTKERVVGGFARSADRKRLYYSSCYGYEAVATAKPADVPRALFTQRADLRVAHARSIDLQNTLVVEGSASNKRVLTVLNGAQQTSLYINGDEPDLLNGWLTYVEDEDGRARGIRYAPLTWPEEARALTSDPNDHSPQWSFDNKFVVFLRGDVQSGRELFAVDLLTLNVRKLHEGSFDLLALSPKDARLVVMEHGSQRLLTSKLSPAGTLSPFIPLRAEAMRGAIQDLHLTKDGTQLWVVRQQREVVAFDLNKPTPPRLIVNGGFVGITEVDERSNGELLLSTRIWEGDLWVAEGHFP